MDELSDWVRSEVGVVVSVDPVKVRPWAAVWRVRAGAGTFFAKQNCALQRYEPGVLRVLADVTCDVTGPTNMLPVNTEITTWAEPARRLHDGGPDAAAGAVRPGRARSAPCRGSPRPRRCRA